MRPQVVDSTGVAASTASTSYSASIQRTNKWIIGAWDQPYNSHRRGALAGPAPRAIAVHRPRPTTARATNDPETSGGDAKGACPPASSSQSPGASAPGIEPETLVDQELKSMWETIKQDVRKDLSPEEAQVLESIKFDDLIGDRGDLMKKLADEQLGPLLKSVGVEEDPLTFFVDLLRLATALQLVSAGVLFYGAELAGGLDSGEAFRCVCGLAAGYLTRPFFKVEQLLWPLYDWGLSFIAPGAVYEVTASRSESQATLTRLGVAVAVCSFTPQLLLGWDSATSLQFVLPLTAGWLLFDVMYMAALLAKLSK